MRTPIRRPRLAAALSAAAAALSASVSAPTPAPVFGAGPDQESIAPAVERATRGLVHVAVLFWTGDGLLVRVQRDSSGVVVDARGLVLTNEHLVDEIPIGGGREGGGEAGEYWLKVVIGGGRECDATLVARDERLDLALLQLELEEGELVAALELAPGQRPAPGTDAFVLGRPNVAHSFAVAGVVAAPGGPVALRGGLLQPDEALLCDAALLRDIDGGPCVDRRGLVLGLVNTFHRREAPPVGEDEEERKKARNEPDYAVVVAAGAVRRAFAERLGAPDLASLVPGAVPGADDEAARIVASAAGAVVGVWSGAADARPQHPAPEDPYAQRPGEGLGSGVVVDASGLVVTSSDVVGKATEVGVVLPGGETCRGEVLRTLPDKRIALLRLVLPEGRSVPAIELGSSGAAIAGESIAVIGNPYGTAPTVSAGVLSALEVENRLRLGAWVHDGHKGGAVVDVAGRLIGIPVADIFEGEEGRERGESYLGVALPIDRVREWLQPDLEAALEGGGGAPGLRAAPEASAGELERRRNRATAIVAATRDSLLNVEVKAEKPRAVSFDPFETPGEFLLMAQGSGVVIDAAGLAITNWHVVHPTLAEDGSQRGDRALEVTLPSGRRYPARVLATSRDDDLALIQLVLPEGEAVQAVPLGASQRLRRGDVAVAIGNPYGKANTVTVGIVAAKDQDANIAGRLYIYEDMLQTDAAINPGNSGGALLDLEGRLIGINSAGRSGAGMAIPVERVREVFGQKLLATMGPFLGLTVEDAPGGGLVVRAVDQHGPAEAAGVAVGDRLRAIDGREVASTVDYANMLIARGNVLLASRSAASLGLRLERGTESLLVELAPLTHAAWRVFRQSGIQVEELDYRSESQQVREASVALHRAYTGLADSGPSRLMSGALRVVAVHRKDGRVFDVQPGDLLLGAGSIVRTVDTEHARLVRFENLLDLRAVLDAVATPEGRPAELWLLRDGKVHTARVPVVRVR